MKKLTLFCLLLISSFFANNVFAEYHLYTSTVSLYKKNNTAKESYSLVASSESIIPSDGQIIPSFMTKTQTTKDPNTGKKKEIEEGIKLASNIYNINGKLVYFFDYKYSVFDTKKESLLNINYKQNLVIEIGKTYRLDGFSESDFYLVVKVDDIDNSVTQ